MSGVKTAFLILWQKQLISQKECLRLAVQFPELKLVSRVDLSASSLAREIILWTIGCLLAFNLTLSHLAVAICFMGINPDSPKHCEGPTCFSFTIKGEKPKGISEIWTLGKVIAQSNFPLVLTEYYD